MSQKSSMGFLDLLHIYFATLTSLFPCFYTCLPNEAILLLIRVTELRYPRCSLRFGAMRDASVYH